jgi:dephospho-CoA kinase
VGDIGSGKDEVLKYLRDRYGVPFLSTGDIVRQMAREDGVEGTRENLEAISKRCFTEMGRGCFVRMAAQEIMKRGWKVAGISGVRSPEDVAAMKEMFGNGFTLVRVDISDPGGLPGAGQERRAGIPDQQGGGYGGLQHR